MSELDPEQSPGLPLLPDARFSERDKQELQYDQLIWLIVLNTVCSEEVAAECLTTIAEARKRGWKEHREHDNRHRGEHQHGRR